MVVGLYFVYDSSRGLVGGGARVAVDHARRVHAWEGRLSLAFERSVQSAAHAIPGLDRLFSVGYESLHLGVTIAVLAWFYRRHPAAHYVRFRNALLIGSLLSIVGFLSFPTAPPRLSMIGIADTVSKGAVSLNSSPLHWLYNPYAAMPSVHMVYALISGASLARSARRRRARVLGFLYPLWVAAEVIATGNHFVLDVLAGSLVAGLAMWAAGALRTDRVRPAVPADAEPVDPAFVADSAAA